MDIPRRHSDPSCAALGQLASARLVEKMSPLPMRDDANRLTYSIGGFKGCVCVVVRLLYHAKNFFIKYFKHFVSFGYTSIYMLELYAPLSGNPGSVTAQVHDSMAALWFDCVACCQASSFGGRTNRIDVRSITVTSRSACVNVRLRVDDTGA